MGKMIIQDNYMNNATTELSLMSITVKFISNLIESALATPYVFTSVSLTTFGNIGLFEGELVATANLGISINQGVANSASLPTADITQRGKIIRVNRSGGTNDDELYMCVYLSAGGYGWKKLTMA
jgi:predicted ATP-dependent Lon-type protease